MSETDVHRVFRQSIATSTVLKLFEVEMIQLDLHKSKGFSLLHPPAWEGKYISLQI